jgi:hypothetical protein
MGKEFEAEEALGRIAAAIKQDECETRQRIDHMTGLDGDYDLVCRQEMAKHFDRVRVLQRQHDELVRLIAHRIACDVPSATVLAAPAPTETVTKSESDL